MLLIVVSQNISDFWDFKYDISHIARRAPRMLFYTSPNGEFSSESAQFRVYYALVRDGLEYSYAVFIGLSARESNQV